MTRGERALLHVANGVVGITGVVYAVMRYLMQPSDDWSVVNHPWQPHLQHLHVLAAPLLVFAVGLVWTRHVAAQLRSGSGGRTSGLGLMAGFVPMAVSGYLIQVTVAEWWRGLWVAVHIASSLLWISAFASHQLRARLVGRRSGITVTAEELDEPG
jgi:hypothetical protein